MQVDICKTLNHLEESLNNWNNMLKCLILYARLHQMFNGCIFVSGRKSSRGYYPANTGTFSTL